MHQNDHSPWSNRYHLGMQEWFNMWMDIHKHNPLYNQTKKNHLIIPLDAEKYFQKYNTPPFLLKVLEISNSRSILKYKKSTIQQNSSQHQCKKREIWCNPIIIREKTRRLNLLLSVQYSTQCLIWPIRQKEKIKGIQIGREEIKILLFEDYIISYLCDPKKYRNKFLQLINNLSKLDWYKINSDKPVPFLYSENNLAEGKKIRKTTTLTIVKNNIKYLGMTLTKQEKYLNDKTFTSLNKEIEEDLKRWQDLLCSLIIRMNIVKMSILPKQSADSVQFSSKF